MSIWALTLGRQASEARRSRKTSLRSEAVFSCALFIHLTKRGGLGNFSKSTRQLVPLEISLLSSHEPPTLPTKVYEDNLACIAMSENPVRRKFSRHIDIRRYFVRDLVAHSIMKLEPLRTHFMVADALTKSLPAPAHAKHRDVMIGRVPFCVRTLRSAFSVVGG